MLECHIMAFYLYTFSVQAATAYTHTDVALSLANVVNQYCIITDII